MRRRLRSAYLSTVISISLVLLLVGVAALLLVNARGVSDYFKELMQISVLMKPDISDAQTLEFQVVLDSMSFVSSTEFISKAQGTREMEQMLGRLRVSRQPRHRQVADPGVSHRGRSGVPAVPDRGA